MQATIERVHFVAAPKELQFFGVLQAGQILLPVRDSEMIRNAPIEKLVRISKLPQAKYQAYVNAARLQLIYRNPKCPDCKGTGSFNSPLGPRLCNRCNGTGMRIE